MALTAGVIIEAARASHPAFDRGLVPSSIGARFVNRAQRKLYQAIHQQNPTYLVRRWTIRMLPDQNVAQVGAGTTGSAPLVVGTTALVRRLVNTGSGATLPDSPSLLVPERAATGGGSLTLVDTTASMPVDFYQGKILVLVSGQGAGQARDIASNTADTFTVTEALDPVPDPTTTYQVLQSGEVVTGDVGISMGQQPTTGERQAWLVYLDAQGNPYLDLAQPVTVPYSVGIPLPPHQWVNHGLVRFLDNATWPDHSETLTLTTLDQQVNPPRPYSACVVNGELQLLRPFEQWKRVTSIEVPYLPLVPNVSGADDILLLPDAAEEALVAEVALQMANRARAMGRLGDAGTYGAIAAEASQMTTLYLGAVTGAGRATVSTIRSTW